MVKYFSIAFCSLFFYCSSAAAVADLRQLQAFFNNNNFTVEFIQKSINSKQANANGILGISRPNKFYWIINSLPAQQIIGDGVRLWIYDRELRQVTVKKQAKALGNTPLALLAGKSVANLDYSWQNYSGEQTLNEHPQQNQQQIHWLIGRPKKEDLLNEIRLGLKDNKIIRMYLKDSFANETQIDFFNYQFKTKFTNQDFTFTPPANTDIIHE